MPNPLNVESFSANGRVLTLRVDTTELPYDPKWIAPENFNVIFRTHTRENAKILTTLLPGENFIVTEIEFQGVENNFAVLNLHFEDSLPQGAQMDLIFSTPHSLFTAEGFTPTEKEGAI